MSDFVFMLQRVTVLQGVYSMLWLKAGFQAHDADRNSPGLATFRPSLGNMYGPRFVEPYRERMQGRGNHPYVFSTKRALYSETDLANLLGERQVTKFIVWKRLERTCSLHCRTPECVSKDARVTRVTHFRLHVAWIVPYAACMTRRLFIPKI